MSAPEFDYDATYYKFIGRRGYRNSKFPYKLGLNKLSDNEGEEFNPAPECGPGGMYFTDCTNIPNFLLYGFTLCKIKIPRDARVVQIDNKYKYKCDQLIIESMKELDVDSIIELIDAGADISTINRWILPWSAQHNKVDIVKFLIDAGANVSVNKDWAIKLAARFGHLDIVLVLLQAGADGHSGREDSALDYACRYGKVKTAEVIITMDLQHVNLYNGRALNIAAEKGYVDLANLLLTKGEYKYRKNHAFVAAARTGHAEIVRAILRDEGEPISDPAFQNSVLWAYDMGYRYLSIEIYESRGTKIGGAEEFNNIINLMKLNYSM